MGRNQLFDCCYSRPRTTPLASGWPAVSISRACRTCSLLLEHARPSELDPTATLYRRRGISFTESPHKEAKETLGRARQRSKRTAGLASQNFNPLPGPTPDPDHSLSCFYVRRCSSGVEESYSTLPCGSRAFVSSCECVHRRKLHDLRNVYVT